MHPEALDIVYQIITFRDHAKKVRDPLAPLFACLVKFVAHPMFALSLRLWGLLFKTRVEANSPLRE